MMQLSKKNGITHQNIPVIPPGQRIMLSQQDSRVISANLKKKRRKVWKSYLRCSDRSENIINRKIGTFYMEAIPRKKIQLRKNTFFFRAQKIFSQILMGILDFSEDFPIICVFFSSNLPKSMLT